MSFLRNYRGYTIVELLISVFIGLILIAGATGTYIAQNRSYVAQESVSEVNTQSKIAHDLIANDIKGAGFGNPINLNTDPVNGFTNLVTPVDNDDTTDAITVVGGFKMIGTLGPGGPCPMNVAAGANSINISYDPGVPDRPDTTDNRYLSIDGINFVQVMACSMDGGGCLGTNIQLDRPVSQNFPFLDLDGDGTCETGRPVYLIEDITFCVDADSTLRRIRRNANPDNCTGPAGATDDVIADNIEDLQFAYAIDADNNGQVDDRNGNGTIDGGDFVNGSAIADPSAIRVVRVNVLALTDRPDPNFRGMGNPPDVIENRNHAETNDSFKRRWWQGIISLRNED